MRGGIYTYLWVLRQDLEWENGRGLHEGGHYRNNKRDKRQIALRLCNKASRDHIVLYLPKIIHNAGKLYMYLCYLYCFHWNPALTKTPVQGTEAPVNGCSGSSK